MQYVSFHVEHILHAILAFDKTKDHLLDGSHIEPKNKYKNLSRRARCVLQAKVVASSTEEAVEIIQEANLNTEGAIYSWCMEVLAKLKPITIQRICNEANELTPKYLIIDFQTSSILTILVTGCHQRYRFPNRSTLKALL